VRIVAAVPHRATPNWNSARLLPRLMSPPEAHYRKMKRATPKTVGVTGNTNSLKIARLFRTTALQHEISRVIKAEASYEANDRFVATRSAKRIFQVLRADGTSLPGPLTA
jgi:hypothetical protein